ncbi:MAG: Dabb family protein [Phycisphaerales bacterium]
MPPTSRSLPAIALTLGLVGAHGCAAPAARTAEVRPQRPAFISHVVFVELRDPADRAALLDDSESMLASIPGVASFAAGEHLDTGRSNIIADYDIGLYIGFDSEEAYATYVTHPSHVAYLDKWGQRVASLRIFDIGDPTP